jgi:hypothetical protein
MEKHNFTRRQALQATAVLGTSLLLPLQKLHAASVSIAATPAITAADIKKQNLFILLPYPVMT